MYKMCVPVENRSYNPSERESLLRELNRVKPDLIYVVFNRVLCNEQMRDRVLQQFLENMAFLQESGFRVGAWLAPTIGYGSDHWGDNDAKARFESIRSLDDGYAKGAFCPLDDAFVDEFLDLVTVIARTGVKDILFEDDFTLTGGKAILLGCCCEKHISAFGRMLGEEITFSDLGEKLTLGGKTKYRQAWSALTGKTLCDFAGKIEKAIHAVDPCIRVGMAANAGSYTTEGVSLPALAKILAGDNKPLIRLTGAPYWTDALTLGPNIDAVRLQEHWCGKEIELLTEGDTYPRPRLWVPAAYLECYDMILRAEGKSDGILKYMLDYFYNADYETGYVDRHCANRQHYEQIEKRFSGKEPVGLNVFEKELLLEEEELGNEVQDLAFAIEMSRLPLMSQRFLSDNCIPTAYEDETSASLVFGANAHSVDDGVLQRGVVLDALAAKILAERGVDVGIRSWQNSNIPLLEHFPASDEHMPVRVEQRGVFYAFDLDDKAQVLSEYIVKDGLAGFANVSPHDRSGKRIPACYLYENAAGQRFMVYAFVAKTVWTRSEWIPGIFRSYYRQRQLADGIAWLQNRPLPAMCFKQPQLYILCKKDASSMTVGIWNLFADTVFTPQIDLDGEYKRAEFYNCGGYLEKDRLQLTTDIIPYGFAVITLYKQDSTE